MNITLNKLELQLLGQLHILKVTVGLFQTLQQVQLQYNCHHRVFLHFHLLNNIFLLLGDICFQSFL